MTYPLENLLPPNIIQPRIQVPHARGQVLHLGLVAALEGAGLANGDIQGQADAAVGLGGGQPAGAAAVGRGREAELVVAGVGGGEGELARGAAALGDDAVVVVEDFLEAAAAVSMVLGLGREGQREGKGETHIDRDVDADAVVALPHLGAVVPFLGRVVADDQGVLGELLEEALGRRDVDEEVEGLGHGGQGQEWEKGPHCAGGGHLVLRVRVVVESRVWDVNVGFTPS